MNILFVNHNALASNSGNHVVCFATELARLGNDVAVAVPDDQLAQSKNETKLVCLSWTQAEHFRFKDGQQADFVHAWTPRQGVAHAARRIRKSHECKIVVHLEDNEHAVAAAYMNLETEDFLSRASSSNFKVPKFLSAPQDMADFIDCASGVSVLTDRLLEFKPKRLPGVVIWPSADAALFKPQNSDQELRRALKIGADEKIIVYNGNVHPANLREMRTFYLALSAS